MSNDNSKTKHNLSNEDLDDALRNTFPASDPVSVGGDEEGTGARIDRQPAQLDRHLVDRLSREVKRKAANAPHR